MNKHNFNKRCPADRAFVKQSVTGKFCSVIVLLACITCSFGQSTQNIDSLKNVINNKNVPAASRDSALFWASWYYLNLDLDSSFWYAQKAHSYAKEIDCRPIEAFSLEIMSDVYESRSNSPKALELLYEALTIFDQLNDSLGRTSVNYDLGNVFFNQNDTTKALTHWRQALSLAPATPLGNTVKSWTLGNLGLAYHRLNKDDLALPYATQAYNLTSKGSENKYLGNIFDLLSGIQYNSGDFRMALEYSKSAVSEHMKNNNPNGASDSYLSMASIFKASGLLDSAFYYARKSLELNLQLKITRGIIGPSKILVGLFINEKRYDSAFKYQQMIDAAKDSVFNQERIKQVQNIAFNDQARRQEKMVAQLQYRNQLKLYGLAVTIIVLLLAATILLRSNRQKQKANLLLQKEKEKTEQTLAELKTFQAQLIQSEKMASLGELTAGIAHEIQNPLNFVNNFSEINKELITEMKDEIDKGNITEVKIIANDIQENEQKINHHGKRADSIVKGMLQHSRTGTGQKELTDINALADEYLRLSYHGMRAKDKSFDATLQTHFNESIGNINIVPQDIGRLLLNLFNNAFYSVHEKNASARSAGQLYKPLILVSTKKINDKSDNYHIEIRVRDNGNGIPKKMLDKIFQPFFTNKPSGQGTGLGLSLSYDIIREHNGTINVETTEGEFAEFIIQLPN